MMYFTQQNMEFQVAQIRILTKLSRNAMRKLLRALLFTEREP